MVERNGSLNVVRNADELRKNFKNIIYDADGISTGKLLHAQCYTRFSVDANDFCFFLVAVFHRADIPYANRNPAYIFHDNIFHRLDDVELAFSLQGVIELSGFQIARRKNKIGVCNSSKNILDGKLQCLHPVAVERDMNFTDASAEHLR